ncbi:hypothetical protein Tco_0876770 [Tanacetum coccineum]|uniref:Integrase, catalytic region, zinc finger, CCHC-type, peptidase aspartic, catalytic n=1 Tax=Tanacetum coccineum TaxID=301880 RepID=A0ABQ5BUX1_9ASTR
MKEQAYNITKTKYLRTQRQSNLNKSMEARFKISPQKFEDHTLGEIISPKYFCRHGSSESARSLASRKIDVQATNIILHGLPPDVYSLVNHQEEAKDIWNRVKMLMKGTELSYQERKCRLYNLLNKFAYVPVNTKFLDALPLEWNKFVTDVKLAKSLYTNNYDQLYAYLSQHERHANEVRINREIYSDSIAFQFTPVYATPIHHQHHHTPVNLVNPQQYPVSPPPFISPSMTPQSQAEFPQLDFGLAIHMMVESPFNKFKEDKFRVMLVQETQELLLLQREMLPRNAAWFREKLMLVEAQEACQILDEEQLAFLADPSMSEALVANQTIPQNSAFQTDDLDAYDSDCDDLTLAKVVLMANLSRCDPEVLFEDAQEMQYSEQIHVDDFKDNKIHSGSNIILYSQYLQETRDAILNDLFYK